MSNSYVSNHVHIVFATKNRLKIIPEELQPKLWAYLAGIAKKSRDARGRYWGHRRSHSRPHQSRCNTRYREGSAGVEGQFIEMDERTFADAIRMAGGILRLQRQPFTSAERYPVHCASEGTPQKNEFRSGICAPAEEAWI